MRVIIILMIVLFLAAACKIQQLTPALPKQDNTAVPVQSIQKTPEPSGGGESAPAINRSPEINKAIIEVGYLSLNPQELNIQAGTEVTWKNIDDILPVHNIIGIEARFQSGKLIYLGDFSYKFNNKGIYHYVDVGYKESDREKYQGTIIVS